MSRMLRGIQHHSHRYVHRGLSALIRGNRLSQVAEKHTAWTVSKYDNETHVSCISPAPPTHPSPRPNHRWTAHVMLRSSWGEEETGRWLSVIVSDPLSKTGGMLWGHIRATPASRDILTWPWPLNAKADSLFILLLDILSRCHHPVMLPLACSVLYYRMGFQNNLSRHVAPSYIMCPLRHWAFVAVFHFLRNET